MRRRWLTALAVACVAVAGWLLYPVVVHSIAEKIRDASGVRVAKAPPDFTLKDAAGKRISLSDFKGKVVLLNFWATWCGPCKFEIPWFIEFEKQYQAQGFTVFGVSMDEDGWKAISPYVAEHHVNYPVVLGDEEVNKLYGGIDALPTTLVIGRDGKVAAIHQGLPEQGRAEYEREIRELLGTS
jgi:cytochrome c biogenesis protein CcmG/thiol:disulfide interchange protein DsbE